MPGLLIKDLPAPLHQKLKRLARAHRRSLQQETLVVLQEALRDPAGPPAIEEIDRMRAQGPRPLTDDLLDDAKRTGRP